MNSTLDGFTLSLIDQYFTSNVKNLEFEFSLIKTLFQDKKYDLILYVLTPPPKFDLTPEIEQLTLESGKLELYQYLLDRGLLEFNLATMRYAVSSGELNTVQWLRANECSWNEDTCAYAAGNGHLEILKWLRANGCPWNEHSCSYAAKNGHLEILKWCLKQDPPCSWYIYDDPSDFAARNGYLDVLKWITEHVSQYYTNDDIKSYLYFRICVAASKYGHLEFLKWWQSSGRPSPEHILFPGQICVVAVRGGHLNILKWWQENKLPWCIQIFDTAVSMGNLDLLKWLHENECPWNVSTYTEAAVSGQLEVLKWLRANGCPWDQSLCTNLAKNGYLKILIWALQNGCPYDKNDKLVNTMIQELKDLNLLPDTI